jgi:DNA polymerase III epsilon subunit-like protein
MLNPNYTYLIIDTETTWLSIEDDDIIQVWLITFDHNWVITNRYTHYVKPEHFTQDQLKPLIWYITGIDTTQIMSAPPMSQIWEQIQQYFGDNVVIIWHNISFDLAMVGKHHRLEYAESIDTMDVARTLLHYQRSYSLEILHQQLLLQPRYQWYLAWLEIKAHDALSDCYTTYALFRHCMERVGDMNKEYKWLENILADWQRSRYLNPEKSEKDSEKLEKNLEWDVVPLGKGEWKGDQKNGGWGLTLPTLKAPLASPKMMVDHEYYDWTTLASTSKIWLEHAGFAASLLKLVHPSRKMIIAFAHRAKLDLAKKILWDHGITWLGYMRENQYINPTQLLSLGSQGQRDHDEVSRMLKYCSHHMQWLSVLDHNTPWDFKVYQRVRLHREDGEADIILSTHAWVYAALQDSTYPDHAILFRDHQRRLSTAQKFYQSGIRIDHMINMIEWVVYKLKHHQPDVDNQLLEELQNRREIVWWVFGSELMAYRTHLPTNNKWNIECLWGIPRDHMTNFSLLYKQKDSYFSALYSSLSTLDKDRISRILTRLDGLLHEGCQIEVQSSYQWDNIIISPASTYVDYADFRQLFAGRHVIFTQTTGQGTDNLTTKLLSHPPTIQLSHIRELTYEVGQKLFILQSNRNQCKTTFDTLMKQWRDKQTLLMGENVTGGGNKLIEQARGAKSYVMVGGYDLYMQTRAADIAFDAVMVIGTLGVLHDQMVRDIEFYAS